MRDFAARVSARCCARLTLVLGDRAAAVQRRGGGVRERGGDLAVGGLELRRGDAGDDQDAVEALLLAQQQHERGVAVREAGQLAHALAAHPDEPQPPVDQVREHRVVVERMDAGVAPAGAVPPPGSAARPGSRRTARTPRLAIVVRMSPGSPSVAEASSRDTATSAAMDPPECDPPSITTHCLHCPADPERWPSG